MANIKEYLKQVVSVQKNLFELYSLWKEIYVQKHAGEILASNDGDHYAAVRHLREDKLSDYSQEFKKLDPPDDILIYEDLDNTEKKIEKESMEIMETAEKKVPEDRNAVFNEPPPRPVANVSCSRSSVQAKEPPKALIFGGIVVMAVVGIATLSIALVIILGIILIVAGLIIVNKETQKNQAEWDRQKAQYDRYLREHADWSKRKQDFDSNKSKALTQSIHGQAKILGESTASALEYDLDQIGERILELQKTYNDLIAQDIIYVKYRNIIACTSMLEYFETGRVSALEGPDGAYNLYESELRSNTIIAKLDEIQATLSRLEQNQYMMAQILRETNKKLDSINSEVNAIRKLSSEQLNVQKDTFRLTAVNAANTAAIAANTEAIKYLSLVN